MRKRAAVTATEVARVVKGAIKGGLPPGSFTVHVEGSAIRLLPAAANEPSDAAAAAEKLMRDAFGE